MWIQCPPLCERTQIYYFNFYWHVVEKEVNEWDREKGGTLSCIEMLKSVKNNFTGRTFSKLINLKFHFAQADIKRKTIIFLKNIVNIMNFSFLSILNTQSFSHLRHSSLMNLTWLLFALNIILKYLTHGIFKKKTRGTKYKLTIFTYFPQIESGARDIYYNRVEILLPFWLYYYFSLTSCC